MPGGTVPCGSCSVGSDTQHGAWHPGRSVNAVRAAGREKTEKEKSWVSSGGASELSVGAAVPARTGQGGPTSASGANRVTSGSVALELLGS